MKKYTDYDIMSMLIESRPTYEEYRYKIRERLSIMVLNESTENYLEAILMLSSKLPVVRSVDIANELGFKKPSISIAMKNLKEKEYITVTDAGYIYLTESGKKIAESTLERHEFFSKWLVSLGVDKATASDDACKIEHVLSQQSFDAIRNFVTNAK